jgi:hypothetical protein
MRGQCIFAIVTALSTLVGFGRAWPANATGEVERVACNRGDPDACSRIIDDVRAIEHDRVAASIKRGLLHRDHGDRNLALADFQKAILLDPHNYGASLTNRCLAIATNDDDNHSAFAYAISDAANSAKDTAVDRCEHEATLNQSSSLTCKVADLSCNGSAELPAVLRPEQDRLCALGEKVTVSGTIQDVSRNPDGWSAGTLARVDNCRGLTDPSTGFAALFGQGVPPASCVRGTEFLASGTAGYGFQPEFFLKVQSITCK